MCLSRLISITLFLFTLYPITWIYAAAIDAHTASGVSFDEACREIETSISNASSVYWPGFGPNSTYVKDISHYAVSSSAQAACSVEPGTALDVSRILHILGKHRTPFAVKGGGHAQNPRFSSTLGVQIAMSRFDEVKLDPVTKTAEVGAGLVWDDVYAALEPHGVIVPGGRISGVGVAGFTLGGGYSWKTNQLGLTIDSVKEFELVLPNGTITSVNQGSYPDLYWGLKGGSNNFGIVTKFVFHTFPQTDVWGGMMVIDGHLDVLNEAIAKFAQTVTDPKAQVLPTLSFQNGQLGALLLVFYDNPIPPAGVFDDFLAIPSSVEDIKTRSFLDLVQVIPASADSGMRGIFHTVSNLQYTPTILAAVLNETQFWGQRLNAVFSNDVLIGNTVELFLPTIFSHAPDNSSAWPPSRAVGLLPLSILYMWTQESADAAIYDAVRQSAEHLTRVAVSEGQDVAHAALYGNYAIFDTPLDRIYGENLESLRALKSKYDPLNVMGLAGGWKL